MILGGDEELPRAQPSTGLEFYWTIAFDGCCTNNRRCARNGGFIGECVYSKDVEIVLGPGHFFAARCKAEHWCSAFISAAVGNTDQLELLGGMMRWWKLGIEFPKCEISPDPGLHGRLGT